MLTGQIPATYVLDQGTALTQFVIDAKIVYPVLYLPRLGCWSIYKFKKSNTFSKRNDRFRIGIANKQRIEWFLTVPSEIGQLTLLT
jgi:hypothetical protein